MRYEVKLVIRIILAFILLLIPFNIFQKLFTDITIKIVYLLLKLIDTTTIIGKYSVKYAIDIQNVTLDITPLCVTASAYYLLILLILLTKDIRLKHRLYILIIGSSLIFIMNLSRIFILIWVMINKGNLFALLHTLLWFVLSTIYVITIWILLSYAYKIKTIPFYSDIKYLYEQSKFKN